MEAMIAILERARLAQKRGYLCVIIESDSLLAVNFYNSNDDNRSELRAIYQEVREIRRAFLALAFRSLDVICKQCCSFMC
jgi:hypothetical protein